MNPTNPAPAATTPLAEADVQTCVRVLRAIEADRSQLARLTQEQRRELLTLAGLVSKPERHDLVKMAKAFRRAERQAAQAHDRQLVDQARMRVQRRSPVYAPLRLEPPVPDDGQREQLHRERACYVCKQPFTKVHRYYDSLCETCGDFNYAKREQTADLDGQYALVTGARIKIGYQASLKLLRAALTSSSRRASRSTPPIGIRARWISPRFDSDCVSTASICATRQVSRSLRAS
jgi:hypothetical protein